MRPDKADCWKKCGNFSQQPSKKDLQILIWHPTRLGAWDSLGTCGRKSRFRLFPPSPNFHFFLYTCSLFSPVYTFPSTPLFILHYFTYFSTCGKICLLIGLLQCSASSCILYLGLLNWQQSSVRLTYACVSVCARVLFLEPSGQLSIPREGRHIPLRPTIYCSPIQERISPLGFPYTLITRYGI